MDIEALVTDIYISRAVFEIFRFDHFLNSSSGVVEPSLISGNVRENVLDVASDP